MTDPLDRLFDSAVPLAGIDHGWLWELNLRKHRGRLLRLLRTRPLSGEAALPAAGLIQRLDERSAEEVRAICADPQAPRLNRALAALWLLRRDLDPGLPPERLPELAGLLALAGSAISAFDEVSPVISAIARSAEPDALFAEVERARLEGFAPPRLAWGPLERLPESLRARVAAAEDPTPSEHFALVGPPCSGCGATPTYVWIRRADARALFIEYVERDGGVAADHPPMALMALSEGFFASSREPHDREAGWIEVPAEALRDPRPMSPRPEALARRDHALGHLPAGRLDLRASVLAAWADAVREGDARVLAPASDALVDALVDDGLPPHDLDPPRIAAAAGLLRALGDAAMRVPAEHARVAYLAVRPLGDLLEGWEPDELLPPLLDAYLHAGPRLFHRELLGCLEFEPQHSLDAAERIGRLFPEWFVDRRSTLRTLIAEFEGTPEHLAQAVERFRLTPDEILED